MMVWQEDCAMSTKLLLEYAMIAEMLCAWTFLAVLVRKKLAGDFSFLAAYAAVWGLDLLARIALLYFHKQIGLKPLFTYQIYFYSSWVFGLIEKALMLFIIYQLFARAMVPFQGLLRLGTMVFKWVCGVAITVTLGIMAMPGHSTLERYMSVGGQFEQAISILTVCLLLFATFSIRYLGMTYRSHLFGASLGLGILGTMALVLSAYCAMKGEPPPLYSSAYLCQSLVGLATLSIWGTYFMLPELERQMVLLPTTSPYFHWNQISAALGDDPGVVAVSGFTPDALSPAERLVLSSASPRKPNVSVQMRVQEQMTATGTQY
jgi:hypothetical protein